MSGWDPSWSRPGPKKPPPAHGLKIERAGTTWWGQRWIEALEQVLRADSGRLARGKTYARAGRTHDLRVAGGKVTAMVTGSRSTPYEVSIELSQLSDAVWQRVIEAMAGAAQFAAALLAGQMPHTIEDIFRQAGTGLFPVERSDLVTTCSCPDWGDPCKHVAATHYVLGEAFDGDPFLLFELRGRTKAAVLRGIRAARGATAGEAGSALADDAQGAGEAAVEIATVTLETLTPADYDRAREPLPMLDFSFDAPTTHAAVLRQLGAPAAWRGSTSPAELLAPLLESAADAARRIALAEPPGEAELVPHAQRAAGYAPDPVEGRAARAVRKRKKRKATAKPQVKATLARKTPSRRGPREGAG